MTSSKGWVFCTVDLAVPCVVVTIVPLLFVFFVVLVVLDVLYMPLLPGPQRPIRVYTRAVDLQEAVFLFSRG